MERNLKQKAQRRKKMFKRQKGITLIALVITIIVMLILAGVSLSMTLGDNGILNRAVDASKQYKVAQEEEQLRLIYNELSMEASFDETKITTANLKSLFNKSGYDVEVLKKIPNKYDNGYFIITFNDTDNIYYLYNDGIVFYPTIDNIKINYSAEQKEEDKEFVSVLLKCFFIGSKINGYEAVDFGVLYSRAGKITNIDDAKMYLKNEIVGDGTKRAFKSIYTMGNYEAYTDDIQFSPKHYPMYTRGYVSLKNIYTNELTYIYSDVVETIYQD